MSKSLRVTADATAMCVFHISHEGDEAIALCGRATEASDVPLSAYGSPRGGHDCYCERCARLAEDALRSEGVRVPLKPRDVTALRAEFAMLSGRPLNSSQPMEMDWHEEYRLAALSCRDQLRSSDSKKLRDQIMGLVNNDVSARIFGSVFAADRDLDEKCFAVFVHCREMRLFDGRGYIV